MQTLPSVHAPVNQASCLFSPKEQPFPVKQGRGWIGAHTFAYNWKRCVFFPKFYFYMFSALLRPKPYRSRDKGSIGSLSHGASPEACLQQPQTPKLHLLQQLCADGCKGAAHPYGAAWQAAPFTTMLPTQFQRRMINCNSSHALCSTTKHPGQHIAWNSTGFSIYRSNTLAHCCSNSIWFQISYHISHIL